MYSQLVAWDIDAPVIAVQMQTPKFWQQITLGCEATCAVCAIDAPMQCEAAPINRWPNGVSVEGTAMVISGKNKVIFTTISSSQVILLQVMVNLPTRLSSEQLATYDREGYIVLETCSMRPTWLRPEAP
jgi:hypothetical protein